MSYYSRGGWAPYVSVAERRRKAEKLAASLKKKGQVLQPVQIEGRTIARTFWGQKWCENLENYSDYENRLPRGRTYARNGSVIDLQIKEGDIKAMVSGSEIYKVSVTVKPLDKARWQAVLDECSGKVASLVELLQGKLSGAVMDVVTRPGKGLFPEPKQISFECSCPDWAGMCKHVAAVLYGVGARLDQQPELLFRLRHVDPAELIQQAAVLPAAQDGGGADLGGADLSALFGIDLGDIPVVAVPDGRAGQVAGEVGKPAKAARADKSAKSDKSDKSDKSGKAAKSAKSAKAAPGAASTTTSKELAARGVPAYMRQYWLNSGVLTRTAERGVYGMGKGAEQTIAYYLMRFS